jgi:uncharacterized protein YqfB (UPF0267 family)
MIDATPNRSQILIDYLRMDTICKDEEELLNINLKEKRRIKNKIFMREKRYFSINFDKC